MPPALSPEPEQYSEESSGEEQVPAQKKGGRPAKKVEEPVEESEEEAAAGSDAESEEDVYVVEKVLSHKIIKNVIHYRVKWQGYDDVKDQTWEPEDNMEGAVDVLNEYFAVIGGRPELKGGQKRKGRQSGVKSESATPAASAKKVKTEKAWSPPPGSWEHDVDYIDTVEERVDPKTGEVGKFAYLVWTNEKKTQHPLRHVYQKCPQKMLQYYESHLVFTQNDGLNGGDTDMKDEY